VAQIGNRFRPDARGVAPLHGPFRIIICHRRLFPGQQMLAHGASKQCQPIGFPRDLIKVFGRLQDLPVDTGMAVVTVNEHKRMITPFMRDDRTERKRLRGEDKTETFHLSYIRMAAGQTTGVGSQLGRRSLRSAKPPMLGRTSRSVAWNGPSAIRPRARARPSRWKAFPSQASSDRGISSTRMPCIGCGRCKAPSAHGASS
jgi:hypothetical protein